FFVGKAKAPGNRPGAQVTTSLERRAAKRAAKNSQRAPAATAAVARGALKACSAAIQHRCEKAVAEAARPSVVIVTWDGPVAQAGHLPISPAEENPAIQPGCARLARLVRSPDWLKSKNLTCEAVRRERRRTGNDDALLATRIAYR